MRPDRSTELVGEVPQELVDAAAGAARKARMPAKLGADVSIVAFSATDATTISTYDGLPDGTIDTYRAATAAAGTPLIATIFDDSPSGTMAAIPKSLRLREIYRGIESELDLDLDVLQRLLAHVWPYRAALAAGVMTMPPGVRAERISPASNCPAMASPAMPLSTPVLRKRSMMPPLPPAVSISAWAIKAKSGDEARSAVIGGWAG